MQHVATTQAPQQLAQSLAQARLEVQEASQHAKRCAAERDAARRRCDALQRELHGAKAALAVAGQFHAPAAATPLEARAAAVGVDAPPSTLRDSQSNSDSHDDAASQVADVHLAIQQQPWYRGFTRGYEQWILADANLDANALVFAEQSVDQRFFARVVIVV
jgi:hypothetical protein